MMLALLPGIYHQLLQMIDHETILANPENRGLAFTLEASDGLWGHLAGDRGCPEYEQLKETPLDPEQWRQKMRALLRTDVYGSDSGRHCGQSEGTGEGQHLGLPVMVTMLEKLAATGPLHQKIAFGLHVSDEKALGKELINSAKRSVHKLIIF